MEGGDADRAGAGNVKGREEGGECGFAGTVASHERDDSSSGEGQGDVAEDGLGWVGAVRECDALEGDGIDLVRIDGLRSVARCRHRRRALVRLPVRVAVHEAVHALGGHHPLGHLPHGLDDAARPQPQQERVGGERREFPRGHASGRDRPPSRGKHQEQRPRRRSERETHERPLRHAHPSSQSDRLALEGRVPFRLVRFPAARPHGAHVSQSFLGKGGRPLRRLPLPRRRGLDELVEYDGGGTDERDDADGEAEEGRVELNHVPGGEEDRARRSDGVGEVRRQRVRDSIHVLIEGGSDGAGGGRHGRLRGGVLRLFSAVDLALGFILHVVVVVVAVASSSLLEHPVPLSSAEPLHVPLGQ
mmetsp:Transcript_46919/g.142125  ORF Transcript_46919/g.142125 Transcript_46919/m.142125 type:complete len:360 (-) Transcript_46919:627-1706(-)